MQPMMRRSVTQRGDCVVRTPFDQSQTSIGVAMGSMNPLVPDRSSDTVEPETVGIIVDALLDKFGERALAVAQDQLRAASADSEPAWLEIIGRLANLTDRPV